jgi:cell division septation protein DedD
MKSLSLLCGSLLVAAMVLAGCAASHDQAEKAADTAVVPAPVKPAASSIPAKIDTVNVAVQKAQKPPYESADPAKAVPTPSAIIKFTVQIGAYKLQENADVVASTAKSRFAKNVYTIHDAATNLYKVMVGDFTGKDEARIFRDRMVQQYPGDYKDAWVSELAQ